MRHPGHVFVLGVFLLAAPALLLAAAVVALAGHGPLGWLAAVILLLAVAVGTRWALRCCLRWWRSTKAPVRAGHHRSARAAAELARGPHQRR